MQERKERDGERKRFLRQMGGAAAVLLALALLTGCSSGRMETRREIERIKKAAESVAEDRAATHILEKYGIEAVAEEEEKEVKNRLKALDSYISSDELDDDMVMELLKKTKVFYETAEKAHFNVQSDPKMISDVKKNAKGICAAIHEAKAAMAASDSLDKLLLLSQDPLMRINKILRLLEKTDKDIKYVDAAIPKRREKINIADRGEVPKYAEEQKQIVAVSTLVANWEVKDDI